MAANLQQQNTLCNAIVNIQLTLHTLPYPLTSTPYTVAREDRRFNGRHDSLLRDHHQDLPAACLTADLGEYCFPQHIVATDLCPDIVWWGRSLHVVELTVPFETSFVEATEGKVRKYGDLTEQAGYTAMLITLEVCVINMPVFTA